MRVAFRQGIIDYQQDGGQPQFVQQGSAPGYLSLNVSPTPTIVTVAHGESNYLLRFDAVANNVWGPLQPGIPNYLYWDIDLVSGQVKYGITILNPIASPTEPPSPQVDQHWFDLSTTTMRVWNGTKWIEVARLFAAVCPVGTTSIITAQPIGSQVGLNVSAQAGYIVFDTLGRPVRGIGRQLLTAATPVRVKTSVGTSGVLTNPLSTVIWARATEPMPAFTLVYFSGDGQISRASGDPALTLLKIPVGIITDSLSANEAGMVTQYGELSWDGWDWSGNIGRPLYCDEFGQLTLIRPGGLLVYRVGFVKGQKSILFQVDAETHQELNPPDAGIVISGNLPIVVPPPVMNTLNEQVFSISIQEATAAQPGFMSAAKVVQLNNHEGRIEDVELALPLKSDVGHTHLVADVTDLQLALDGKADVGHDHNGVYAPVVHGHSIAEVVGLQLALDGKADVGHDHDGVYSLVGHDHDAVYSQLGHTHVIAEVSLLQDSLDTKANVVHTHTISDVSGLQAELNQKANIVHTHTISNVTGLQVALDGKASVIHTHDISDVTGLQLALDGKASFIHTHDISDVTGLQLALDGKADVVHGHTAADISDFSEGVDDRVAALLQAGANITLNYNDGAGTLTISAAGGGGYTAPSTEVVLGGSTNNDSSPNFTYDKDTGTLLVNGFGPDTGTGSVLIRSSSNGSGLGASELSMGDPSSGASSVALYAGNLDTSSGASVFLAGAQPDYGGHLELTAGNGNVNGSGGNVYITGGATGGAGAGSIYLSAADFDGNDLPGGSILVSSTTGAYSLASETAELAITSGSSVALGAPAELTSGAETGFVFIPTINGAPVAAPFEATLGDRKPIVYQPGAQLLWAFDGNEWHTVSGEPHIADTYCGFTSAGLNFTGTLSRLGSLGFTSLNDSKFTDAFAGDPGEIYFKTPGYYKIIVQCRLDNNTPAGAFPNGSFVYGIKLACFGDIELEGYGGEPSDDEMFTRHIRYQNAADLTGCPVTNVDRRESWTDSFVINVTAVDPQPHITLDGYVYKNGHTGTCILNYNVTIIRLSDEVTGY